MAARLRAAWATATSTPWRRAPVLLLRRPGVLAAVAGATMVMVAAVAAVPLFLSSAGTASVALQAEERCPVDTGVSRVEPVSPERLRAPAPDLFAPLADRLTETNHWAEVDRADLDGDPVTVLAREHATAHVDVLDGGGRDGVWITDRAATRTGLGVGDTADLGGLPVRVAAVYRDLAGYTVDRFWCSNNRSLLVRSSGGDFVLPPPVVLADRRTVAALLEARHQPTGTWASEAALRPDLTVAEARDLAADLACRGRRRRQLRWCAHGQPEVVVRFDGDRTAPAASDRDFLEDWFDSSLPFVLARSQAIRTSVRSGIWPVALLATLAGAGLVAAAASLWFDRRRRDVAVLSVRGVSPLGIGTKAVLELVLPLVAGAAAGLALAYGMVVWLGPASRVEPTSVAAAGRAAAIALVGAAATVAAVVTARVRGHGVRRHRRWALVPWELGLAAAAVAAYHRLGQWGVPIGHGASVSKVDVWGLLFPVLFLLAVIAVASRVLGLVLVPVRAASGRWPLPLFLAVRRVARARAATVGLLAATALAAGVLVYAATMGGSLHATLDAKARTFVGSDTEVDLPDGATIPASLAGRSTVVVDNWDGRLGADSVAVLAVDPATFADAAYWDDTFADQSLADLLDRLRPGRGVVPAITVGIEADVPTRLTVGQGAGVELTVRNVAHVRAFPGMRRARPTVYLAADALPPTIGAESEAWIVGGRADALAELQRAGIPFEETRKVTDVVDGSSFVTVSWTFGFMRSLGLAAGLLALGGVAVHLEARRRERVLGHTFLRRMGLRPGQHRVALLVELAASILVGCTLGLLAAVAGAAFAYGRLDPVPGFAPAPLLRVSSAAALGSLTGAVVVVVVGALVAHRRTEADDPVEVLRAGA